MNKLSKNHGEISNANQIYSNDNQFPFNLSKAQAAQYMGISDSSIHRLIKSGSLRASKILTRVLVRKADCDALLQANSE